MKVAFYVWIRLKVFLSNLNLNFCLLKKKSMNFGTVFTRNRGVACDFSVLYSTAVQSNFFSLWRVLLVVPFFFVIFVQFQAQSASILHPEWRSLVNLTRTSRSVSGFDVFLLDRFGRLVFISLITGTPKQVNDLIGEVDDLVFEVCQRRKGRPVEILKILKEVNERKANRMVRSFNSYFSLLLSQNILLLAISTWEKWMFRLMTLPSTWFPWKIRWSMQKKYRRMSSENCPMLRSEINDL